MTPLLLVGTFAAGTLLSWLILSVVLGGGNPVERRLRRHGAMGVIAGGDEVVEAPEFAKPARRVRREQQGGGLAKLFTTVQRRRRMHAFQHQIVDALTLISSSLKAGYSFIQAMDMVAREVPAPLGEEFGRAVHEMSLGASVEESLEEMVRRMPLEELNLVVTAVLVQRQVGGNLSEVLDNIAFTIRERIRVQGEIRSLTAQGRISGWIIGLMPMALAAIIGVINPDYMMTLFTHPLGQLIVVAGLCGQLIGALLIKKIITIEV